MAKKSVASLKDKSKKGLTKVFIPVKNEKTGAYSFRSEMVPEDMVDEYLKNNAPAANK